MFNKKNLPLRADEVVVDIIRPSGSRYYIRIAIGFCIVTLNSFFTFWLWQKGIEGQIFYFIVWFLGLYIILYGTLFGGSNYLVVTSDRIFDVQRESLFNETISTLHFNDLADVVIRQTGLLASLFNYGALTLHPREGKFNFEIEKVPQPARVRDLLFERREHARITARLLEKDAVFKRLIKLLPEYSEAELTLLYQKVHSRLLEIAKATGEKPE
ncbi:MAG: hypothetical protein AAB467_04640 [Patescibacteria group bacterium]|mgnify:CR=1 FL=1